MATNTGPHGAAVTGNKVYRIVAAEVIGQLKKAGCFGPCIMRILS
jgi:hypothetical protein